MVCAPLSDGHLTHLKFHAAPDLLAQHLVCILEGAESEVREARWL